MNPQIYGIVGITVGLVMSLPALVNGPQGRNDLAGILLIGGIFIFGCGLVAAAVGARK
jgi:hypothetical protein